MAIPTGATAYKKKDGVLTLTPDQKTVIWTANSAAAGPPALSLSISNITNLQQTPDSAAKVMLKIFEKGAESAEPVPYLFHFNSPADPRAEANVIKNLLSRLLADAKSNDPNLPKPSSGAATPLGAGGSGSATMAFANTVNSGSAAARLFDDDSLKGDIVLQQSLLKADRNLSQMYMEGRKTKPDSMSDTSFNAHFWSARTNLLRSHAIESSQKRGPYNVLAQVKPILVPNEDPSKQSELKIKVTQEQISAIMSQHPLLKRIFNEHVPPLSQNEFWERFFLSKLSKKLRGERPSGLEIPDKIFDKYDEYEDITAFSSKLLAQHVPHIINVEGNEENQGGFKSGNRKDVEMRPRGRADVPIIQTLNSLSGKLLVNVLPADNDPGSSTQVDDDTYQGLALRDLQGDVEDHRVILNIREQSRFFSSESSGASETATIFAQQDPAEVLKSMQEDLKNLTDDGAGGVNIHDSLGIYDSESDEEEKLQPHVGSRESRKEAHKQIVNSILRRRAQLYGHGSEDATPMGLPVEIAANCNLTHATTMEFLHQFWSAFLSGDPERAAEVGYLAEALKRSKDRIEAVSVEAEKARDEQIKKRKAEIMQIYERSKKKVKFNAKTIGGGREAVTKLMEPVVRCLDKAIADYQKALAAEGLQASTEL
ncbi:putative transcription initiation factor TFIIH subunit 1 [Rosellinia necatrix]|uniref:Putative transcription initiation factor TFIIH subunit 1 n=1 Tax=Rosellinia necatrix TaxID=77044 RepID=A0A1W2TUC9_ROSNE|nr:putative transcription initiation factor TFIIH subunit 1 [Rosellinia necatrix]